MEYIFRAWDENESRMIYSGTEQNDYPFSWMIHIDGIEIAEHDGTDWNYLKKLIFMQYTGLQDKSNNRIYEHDIVKWRFKRCWETEYHISEVVWDDFYSAFKLSLKGSNAKMRKDIEYEILGNSYENKELLK